VIPTYVYVSSVVHTSTNRKQKLLPSLSNAQHASRGLLVTEDHAASVYLSADHAAKLRKNSSTDRDAIQGGDACRQKAHCIRQKFKSQSSYNQED